MQISTLLFITLFAGSVFAEANIDGLSLPSGFKRVSENRYQANRTYSSVKRAIEKQLRNKSTIKILEDRSYPGIKYFYVRSLKDGRNWDGLHFYSEKRGSVGLYILNGLSSTNTSEE